MLWALFFRLVGHGATKTASTTMSAEVTTPHYLDPTAASKVQLIFSRKLHSFPRPFMRGLLGGRYRILWQGMPLAFLPLSWQFHLIQCFSRLSYTPTKETTTLPCPSVGHRACKGSLPNNESTSRRQTIPWNPPMNALQTASTMSHLTRTSQTSLMFYILNRTT